MNLIVHWLAKHFTKLKSFLLRTRVIRLNVVRYRHRYKIKIIVYLFAELDPARVLQNTEICEAN